MDSKEILSLVIGLGGFVSILIAFWEKIFNNGRKNENIVNRVGDLEKLTEKTCQDIDSIKNNHLAHIQADINRININLAKITTTLSIKFDEE